MIPKFSDNLEPLFDRNSIERNKETIADHFNDTDKGFYNIVKFNSDPEIDDLKTQKYAASVLYLAKRFNKTPSVVHGNWNQFSSFYSEKNDPEEVYNNISLNLFPEEKQEDIPVNDVTEYQFLNTPENQLQRTTQMAGMGGIINEGYSESIKQFGKDLYNGTINYASSWSQAFYRIAGELTGINTFDKLANEAQTFTSSIESKPSKWWQENVENNPDKYYDPRFWISQGMKQVPQMAGTVATAGILRKIPSLVNYLGAGEAYAPYIQASEVGTNLAEYMSVVYGNITNIAVLNADETARQMREQHNGTDDQIKEAWWHSFNENLSQGAVSSALEFFAFPFAKGKAAKGLATLMGGVIESEQELRENEKNQLAINRTLDIKTNLLPVYYPRVYNAIANGTPEEKEIALVAGVMGLMFDPIMGLPLSHNPSSTDKVLSIIKKDAAKRYGKEFVAKAESEYDLVNQYQERKEQDALNNAAEIVTYNEAETVLNDIKKEAEEKLAITESLKQAQEEAENQIQAEREAEGVYKTEEPIEIKEEENAGRTRTEVNEGGEQEGINRQEEEQVRLRSNEKNGLETETRTEAKPVKQVKGFKTSSILNYTPVINFINEFGGISKKTANYKGGEYDGAIPNTKAGGFVSFIYSGVEGKNTPDIMAQALYDEGLISSPDFDEMWSAIENEVEGYRKGIKKSKEAKIREKKTQLLPEEEQHEDFIKDTQEKSDLNKKNIDPETLALGDIVEVKYKQGKRNRIEKLEVIDIDPDTLEITLKDGERYGIQKIENGETFYASKIVEEEGGADFEFGIEEEVSQEERILHYLNNPKELLNDAGIKDETSFMEFFKDQSDVVKQKAHKAMEELKEEFGGKLYDVTGVMVQGTKNLYNMAAVGAEIFVEVGGNLKEWNKKMRSTFGAGINPLLNQIYKNSQAICGSQAIRQELMAKALYKVMKEQFPDSYNPELKRLANLYAAKESYQNILGLMKESRIPISDALQAVKRYASQTLSQTQAKNYINNFKEKFNGKETISNKALRREMEYFNNIQMERLSKKAQRATPENTLKSSYKTSLKQKQEIKQYKQSVKAQEITINSLKGQLRTEKGKTAFLKNFAAYVRDNVKQTTSKNQMLTQIKELAKRKTEKGTERQIARMWDKFYDRIKKERRDKVIDTIYKGIQQGGTEFIRNIKKEGQDKREFIVSNEFLDNLETLIREQMGIENVDIPMDEWLQEGFKILRNKKAEQQQLKHYSIDNLETLQEMLDFYKELKSNRAKEIIEKELQARKKIIGNVIEEQKPIFAKKHNLLDSEDHDFTVEDKKKINSLITKPFLAHERWFSNPWGLTWSMDGYKEGILYNDLLTMPFRKAEEKVDSVNMQISKLHDEVFGRHYEKINDAEWETESIEISFDGKETKLSPYQIISLYRIAQQEDGIRHLLGGGFKIEKDNHFVREYKVTSEDIDNIRNIVDSNKDYKKAADYNLQVFQMLADYINDASMKINGYKIARIENYFPLFVSRDDVNNFFELVKDNDGNLSSQFNVKKFHKFIAGQWNPFRARTKSVKPLSIVSASKVLSQAMNTGAMYYGFTEPITRAESILADGSFKKAITHTWGDMYYKALNRLVGHVMDSKYKETMSRGYGKFIKFTTVSYLGLSPVIMAYQPVSYITALAKLPGKYWAGGFPNVAKYIGQKLDKKFEFIGKYSPMLYMRYRGQISVVAGDVLTGITGRKFSQLQEKSMAGIQHMDNATIASLWDTCTKWVEDETDLTGDAKWKEVAKRTSKVVNETQPMFHKTARNEMARQGDPISILLSRFTSQTSQLYTLTSQMIKKAKNGNTEEAGKMLISLLLSTISIGLLKSLAKALRAEAKETLKGTNEEEFLGHFYNSLPTAMTSGGMGMLGPVANLTGNLINMGKRYNPEPVTSTVQDTIETGKAWVNYFMLPPGRRTQKRFGSLLYYTLRSSSILSGLGGSDLYLMLAAGVKSNMDKNKRKRRRK